MSKGVNKAIIVGNVTQDPETRYTQSGKAVANFSLATSEFWKDKNTGNEEKRTEYHKIVFFGKLAEIVSQYVKKGTKLYVEGSLRTRKWQDQSGQDRYTTEIVGSVMQMLDSRGETAAPRAAGGQPNSPAVLHSFSGGQPNPVATDNFDDIPF